MSDAPDLFDVEFARLDGDGEGHHLAAYRNQRAWNAQDALRAACRMLELAGGVYGRIILKPDQALQVTVRLTGTSDPPPKVPFKRLML